MGLFSFGFNRHSPSEPGRGRIFSPLLRPCQTCGAESKNSYRDGTRIRFARDSPLEGTGFELPVPRQGEPVRGLPSAALGAPLTDVTPVVRLGHRGTRSSGAATKLPFRRRLPVASFGPPRQGRCFSFELSGRLLREQDWRSEMSLAPAPDLPCPRGLRISRGKPPKPWPTPRRLEQVKSDTALTCSRRVVRTTAQPVPIPSSW
jgi:hypothetical protein